MSAATPEPIESTSNTMAVISLVAGLASLVLLVIYFVTTLGATFLTNTIIVGLLGVVFAIVALKQRQSRGMAITGLITGALTVLVAIAIFVFALIFVGAFSA